MKTILIATDFSAAALNAARFVGELSRYTDTDRIILYHSYHPEDPEIIMVTDVLAADDSELQELKERAIQGLNDLQATLGLDIQGGIKIDIRVDDRLLTHAIKEIAELENVDMVVMGMKKIIGRHTFQMMKECEKTLLIIPSTAVFKGLNRMMLACDLNGVAERLPVAQLKGLLKNTSSKLFVVNVEHNGAKNAADIINEEADLHQLLDDVNPEYYYPVSKNKPETLIRFAEGHQIDMVITVHKKRGLVEELFHNSLTKRLAIQTDIPLLILHKQ